MEGINEDGEKIDVEALKSLSDEELKTLVKLAKKQIEEEQKKEEENKKKRIIEKIRKRMPSLEEEKLLELDTKDLGTTSRILKKLDYHEPFIPLQKYSKTIETVIKHRKLIAGIGTLILILAVLGAYL